jgi:hypothetical protein
MSLTMGWSSSPSMATVLLDRRSRSDPFSCAPYKVRPSPPLWPLAREPCPWLGKSAKRNTQRAMRYVQYAMRNAQGKGRSHPRDPLAPPVSRATALPRLLPKSTWFASPWITPIYKVCITRGLHHARPNTGPALGTALCPRRVNAVTAFKLQPTTPICRLNAGQQQPPRHGPVEALRRQPPDAVQGCPPFPSL